MTALYYALRNDVRPAPDEDPDLRELQKLAKRLRLAVRVSVAARFRNQPCIEVRALHQACSLLKTFPNARAAIDWLQPQGVAA